MLNGIINVYKETGFTSHDVVAKLRGICGQRRIGHTGTLDPDAVGVLPVCLGSGTRLCGMLTDRTKEYVALLRLGTETDTQDLSGTVLEEKPVLCGEDRVREAVEGFLGNYMQIPPMYSALKVDGKKLYELARAGREVERAARPVFISELEILECRLPEVRLRVVCSKGTYIRTLCHDIGHKLGCGGAMASLVRTRVGEFSIENALTLTQLQALRDEGRLGEAVLPVDSVFKSLAALKVREECRRLVENGNALKAEQVTVYETAAGNAFGCGPAAGNAAGIGPMTGNADGNGLISGNADGIGPAGEAVQETPYGSGWMRVYGEDGHFFGIYEWSEEKEAYRPVKMFPSGE